jgi:hypothetical protein
MLLIVMIASVSVLAVPVFVDTFENKTVGNSMATGDLPTTGLNYWVNYSSAGAATYQLDGANKVLKGDRTGGKNVAVQAFAYGTESNLVSNTKVVFSFDWKSNGDPNNGPQVQIVNDLGTVIGGLLCYGGSYNYYIAGGFYGAVPTANAWNTVKIVMNTGVEVYPGFVQPRYDVYANGVLIAPNITGSAAATGGNLRLNLYVAAANGVMLYDNVSMERFAAQQCSYTAFFEDTFENRTVGDSLFHTELPTSGAHYWLSYNTAGAATYQLDGTNKVLKADRTSSGYVKSVAFSGGIGSDLTPNTDFVFSFDWKSDGVLWSGPSVNLNFGGGTIVGSVLSYAGGYNYSINGAWYGTVPAANIWHTVQMVVKVGAASGGNVPTSYDVYADGTLLKAGVAGPTISETAGNARMEIYVSGANGVVLYDNVSLGRLAAPVCGDACHPYMKWDLSKDCVVNFADFAELAENWMISY